MMIEWGCADDWTLEALSSAILLRRLWVCEIIPICPAHRPFVRRSLDTAHSTLERVALLSCSLLFIQARAHKSQNARGPRNRTPSAMATRATRHAHTKAGNDSRFKDSTLDTVEFYRIYHGSAL